ncbi:hypothetical protein [Streptomyces sp. NPDC127084]|uniref:hypothetical protein n=1 Tax=Streptomyces sp. NPDC127084 TaxID=3347133 RepID=UPI003657709C
MNTKPKASVAIGATALILADLTSGYLLATDLFAPHTTPGSLGMILLLASTAATVLAGLKTNTALVPAGLAAAGLGFLVVGLVYGNTVSLVAGLCLSVFGSTSAVLLWRATAPHRRAANSSAPRARATRLCEPAQLDTQLLGLLETTTSRYSLGDLHALSPLCCETRYDNARIAPAPWQTVLGACVLAGGVVILLDVHASGDRYAVVGRLSQTTLSGPHGQESGDLCLRIHSTWFGHAEAASREFGVDEGQAMQTFVTAFHERLTSARHAL